MTEGRYRARVPARVPDRDESGNERAAPADPRSQLGEFVTLTRATQLANVSRQTITLWVRDGELVPVVEKAKIPGARGRPGRLFRAEDVVRVARAHGTLPLGELLGGN